MIRPRDLLASMTGCAKELDTPCQCVSALNALEASGDGLIVARALRADTVNCDSEGCCCLREGSGCLVLEEAIRQLDEPFSEKHRMDNAGQRQTSG